MQFLYERALSEYVWYFSDDDILLSGAIRAVLEALSTHSPDALLFSLRQPPDSTTRTFDYPERVKVFEEPITLIELLAQCPKISIYVLRRIDLDTSERQTLQAFLGTNYYFIALAYSILARSSGPKLCVISEPLVTCDSDFFHIRLEPETWGNLWQVFRHPYVVTYTPHLAKIRQRASYYILIQFLFAAKVGTLVVEDRKAYDAAIRNLPCHLSWLLKNRKNLLQFVLLKLRLTFAYALYRRIHGTTEMGHQ